MKGKKNALGKGLGALIPNNDKIVQEENFESGVIHIDINKISPNKSQPRKNFDEEKLDSLCQSIKRHGIIQPILVRKDGDFYTIIAGERRWRAARMAGLKSVPIIEKDFDSYQVMEVSLIENIQREDLNPIEEATAYKRLIDEFQLTQEDVANRIGKSRTVITNSMRLLNLDNRVIEYIREGILSEGHGKILVGLSDKNTQYELAQKIIDDGLSVRQTEKLVKLINTKTKGAKSCTKKDIYIIDIQEKLKSYFGTKVTINQGKNKGKIEIEYYSEEDLQRIIDMFHS